MQGFSSPMQLALCVRPQEREVEKKESMCIVLLSEFPCIVGPLEAFKLVENNIGHFILVEEETILAAQEFMSNIMVDNEVSEGLPTEIEVIWDGGSFS